MTPQTMRRIRQYHLYAGVFFAPLIILLAFSGALQTFRLQEEKGWGSQPPAWIEYIASIHMDSKLPRAKGPATVKEAPAKAEAPAKPGPKPPQVNKLPMQILMVAMSIGLMLSAFLGIAIALNSKLTRRMSVIMLVAGSFLPMILLQAA